MNSSNRSEQEIKEFSDFLVPLKQPSLCDPFRWVKLGFMDFIRAPGIGLFFGACFVAMGWSLVYAFQSSPAMLLGLSAGFLLLGPLLCMGLYHVSYQLEQNKKPGFEDALMAWSNHFGTMAIFGIVLLVVEMVWARASLVVFALALEEPMPALNESLSSLLKPEVFNFVLGWLGLGAIFATVIFLFCVVSIPMILHRGTDAISAGLTSVRLVLSYPLVMGVWAFLIVFLVLAAMIPGFLGLLLVGPILGHSTWHAYRQTVG